MTYLHQERTVSKAIAFTKSLNKTEYKSVVDPDGTRDYLAKIDIYFGGEHVGSANVYYSPKKDSYKLTLQSLKDPVHREKIAICWERFCSNQTPLSDDERICAYVDGSYMNGRTGYGAVIIKNNNIQHEIYGTLDEKFNGHHQVGGELKAVLETVKWCKKNKIKDLHIYYDYSGIEMWATGKWKTKNEMTRMYQEYMLGQSIDLHFHKVAAHSGNRWNEYADGLAKKGTETS